MINDMVLFPTAIALICLLALIDIAVMLVISVRRPGELSASLDAVLAAPGDLWFPLTAFPTGTVTVLLALSERPRWGLVTLGVTALVLTARLVQVRVRATRRAKN